MGRVSAALLCRGEGGKLVLAAGSSRTMERLAHTRASDGDDAVMISVDAHGYAEVAGHHEQIFSDIDIALDFTRRCGGRLEICAASDQGARVEILLPDAQPVSVMVSGQLS